MKKYFFLIFLLFIYFILSLNDDNKTKQVVAYKDFINDNVYDINIEFKNGINSKVLYDVFTEYNHNYYVKEISLENEKFELSCKNFMSCINEIFLLKDNDFYNKYIISGFKIKSVNFIAYKDEVIPFLAHTKFNYTIK